MGGSTDGWMVQAVATATTDGGTDGRTNGQSWLWRPPLWFDGPSLVAVATTIVVQRAFIRGCGDHHCGMTGLHSKTDGQMDGVVLAVATSTVRV